jgi:hypothetical protein
MLPDGYNLEWGLQHPGDLRINTETSSRVRNLLNQPRKRWKGKAGLASRARGEGRPIAAQ